VHLLLGVLGIDKTYASQLLTHKGVTVESLRAIIATLERREPGGTKPKEPDSPEQRSLLETIKHWGDLNRRGRKKEALKFLDGLIADPKLHPMMRKELLRIASTTALSIGDFAKVRRYNELLLAEDPNDAMSLYALADCAAEQSEPEKAREYAARCYERALALEEPLRKGIIELLETRFPRIQPHS
jgi:tetratricopeptide (TPR) repeat protein